MSLRQEQQLKQTQKLSPLQMQVIKLVELTSVELEDKIKQEIEDNPALEIGATDSWEGSDEDEGFADDPAADSVTQEEMMKGDYMSEDDLPDYPLNAVSDRNPVQYFETNFSDEKSLNESLLEQIGLRKLDPTKKKIAEYIIGNLDENGYLQRDLHSISNDLLFQQGMDIPVSELQDTLLVIQELDPAGVGARSLQECLVLQLKRRQASAANKLAIKILSDYFEEFSKKHYEKISRQLNIERDDMREVIAEIVSLNPKPGNAVGNSMDVVRNNITPDFIVEIENGEINMWLNNYNIPELKVNRDFSEMMQGYSKNKDSMSAADKQAMLFMKQKLDSAKWFIDAVKQRQNTLLKTMNAIIAIQYDFFLTEDETMLKPMILKDVAEKTGFHLTTISRVSSSKYVQTGAGVYPLKFFFSEAMQNDAGEDVSSREIKFILKEGIDAEDSSKPLTDDQLTRILNDKGYVIARRTVAKYREQLNIPVARLRKKI
ncbi:MAG: RNA polymerase factor sigma-54 [Dysgonamonadaceae bacterium]|jgi:RNA polymerase sigma-54 factor|nr:RNA polymerase factor sigma-54 [Dysgonamonadaceae bacterium]